MCDYRYGVEKKIEDLKRGYHLESLKQTHESAKRDLEEITQGIKQYLAAIDDHIKAVEATTFTPYVRLDRRVNNDNKVEYEVCVKFLPEIPEIIKDIEDPERGRMYLAGYLEGRGNSKYYFPSQGMQRFKGTERRAALAYADTLAKEHGAEIVKGGWGWKDKVAA
jgi:hypothetical protein